MYTVSRDVYLPMLLHPRGNAICSGSIFSEIAKTHQQNSVVLSHHIETKRHCLLQTFSDRCGVDDPTISRPITFNLGVLYLTPSLSHIHSISFLRKPRYQYQRWLAFEKIFWFKHIHVFCQLCHPIVDCGSNFFFYKLVQNVDNFITRFARQMFFYHRVQCHITTVRVSIERINFILCAEEFV